MVNDPSNLDVLHFPRPLYYPSEQGEIRVWCILATGRGDTEQYWSLIQLTNSGLELQIEQIQAGWELMCLRTDGLWAWAFYCWGGLLSNKAQSYFPPSDSGHKLTQTHRVSRRGCARRPAFITLHLCVACALTDDALCPPSPQNHWNQQWQHGCILLY